MTKFIKNIPVTYWQRHLRSFAIYGTPRKYSNIFRAYCEYLLGRERIVSKPAFLKVEICRFCDVNCLYCENKKAKTLYPLDLYKQIVDQFCEYIFLVSLYDIGEPLHNPQVVDYIQYAKKKKIGTIISSSLSLMKSDSFWIDLVMSGLDTLIVAIDGISAEVYRKYRQNGKYELVMSNLKKIIELRDRYKSKMIIEWQMIDFEWNRHEQSDAKRIAYELGCDRFRLIAEVSKKREAWAEQNFLRKRNCILPYILLFITSRNEVRLCYKIYSEDMRIGCLKNNSFEEIWNGSEIAEVRDRNKISKRPGCNKCRE